MGYSRKKTNILFWCPFSPGIVHFFTLTLEIPDKTKLHPWKFQIIVLDSKNQDLWLPEILHAISSLIPFEIPYPLSLPNPPDLLAS